eukprot:Skav216138  [mRNA]  locus=scaffold1946:385890:392524:- [translate_table: standard]
MGVVLYEMLSLVQPFAASNVAALIMKIVNAEPPPLPKECREEVCDATWPSGTQSTVVQPGVGLYNAWSKPWCLGRLGMVWPEVKTVDFSRMPEDAQKGAKDEVGLLSLTQRGLSCALVACTTTRAVPRRRLAHPHIIAYYDAFFEADCDPIRAQPRLGRSETGTVELFRQCLSALCYIHKKRVLHRDIKTQNIFLMKTGDAKLGDFGISKVMDGTVAEAGTVVGTPAYLGILEQNLDGDTTASNTLSFSTPLGVRVTAFDSLSMPHDGSTGCGCGQESDSERQTSEGQKDAEEGSMTRKNDLDMFRTQKAGTQGKSRTQRKGAQTQRVVPMKADGDSMQRHWCAKTPVLPRNTAGKREERREEERTGEEELSPQQRRLKARSILFHAKEEKAEQERIRIAEAFLADPDAQRALNSSI